MHAQIFDFLSSPSYFFGLSQQSEPTKRGRVAHRIEAKEGQREQDPGQGRGGGDQSRRREDREVQQGWQKSDELVGEK